MPIFDYRCQACGHTFDILQKLGADALTDCPECGQPELRKLLSAPAFHLKGKGWRNSDDTPRKPNVRPKFGHMFDSATPHAEHTDPAPAGHSHDHGEEKGGVGKIVRDHVHSHDHSHNHGNDKKSGSDSHDHSHGHSHGHSHKHDD
ncbi:MAG: zinc ribbon domain-containing protein [Gammaproteobacteria bacterium]|jgi:putative FmdB family regulatory protein|nr:zinc ribbon domain-containing protein [Gammaproteobacteria bacterium]MDP6694905.1 zinc ribbon domain-containing protein [Gammaproteobacteria bacterium]